MNTKPEDYHAEQNAKAWAESIAEMVAALECDYGRLGDMREERANIESGTAAAGDQESEAQAIKDLAVWDAENASALAELESAATVDGDKMENREEAEQRIQESALSVEVRDGWRAPGGDAGGQAEEFRILLTTGGPACRIMGELDEHGTPSRAWLEYQDRGTAWTHCYIEGFAPTLLTFCEQFYFGN